MPLDYNQFRHPNKKLHRYTIEQLHEHAMKLGGWCTDTEYLGGSFKYTWKCQNDEHPVWRATWYDVNSKQTWCRICSELAIIKYSIEDLYRYADAKGGKCLSTTFTIGAATYLWQCKENHPAWESTWHSIKDKNRWCPHCAGNIRREPQMILAYCKASGIICLSDLSKYINNKQSLAFQCLKDATHQWETCWNRISSGRTRCPHCIGNRLLTYEYVKSKIEERGYIWLDTEYVNSKAKLNLMCSKGHSWTPIWESFNNGRNCPDCSSSISRPHQEISDYITSLGFEIKNNDRIQIKPLELDIWIPSKKFAIEFDGLYWHSTKGDSYSPGRTARKYWKCVEQGISAFFIFEDEWRDKQDLVKAMIKYRVSKFDGKKLDARKLILKEVPKSEYKGFFEKYHLDGNRQAQRAIGLYLEDELIICASFHQNNRKEWEISRLATDYHYTVRGGAQRIITAFPYRPLVTFSNNRFSTGHVYSNMGFVEITKSKQPGYYYTDTNSGRIRREKCRKINDPAIVAQHPTEKLQALNGVFSQKLYGDARPLYRIEDAGHRKWLLK